MDLQKYLATKQDGRSNVDRIVCADGFSMSVQASRYHYCTPQDDVGPWTHVEVGFPSADEVLLSEYLEDEDSGVAPRTPITLIHLIIAKHGGVVATMSALDVTDPHSPPTIQQRKSQ